jgi:ATP-dependent Clp protease ATP-binding subunit ClpX
MKNKNNSKDIFLCNFCGKPSAEVGHLIESNISKDKVRICFVCHNTCSHIFSHHSKQYSAKSFSKKKKSKNFDPRSLKEYLDQYVIGQDFAKKALSIAVANHYKRINEIVECNSKDEVILEKTNVLLVGPTGCGKTMLIKRLAKFLNVPLAIGDATSLTEAGYVGDDVESLISTLLRNCDFDIEAAQSGIIYIDEIDKLSISRNNVSISKDVGGEGVQQSLLKIIEGTTCNVSPQGGRKHPEQKMLHIDTTNILFIVGGTFAGIEDILAKRNGRKMGFHHSAETAHEQDESVLPEDLIKFGMIPEFIGRFPLIQKLEKLSVEDLVTVLEKPKNSLVKQYKKQFQFDNVQLTFEKDALYYIAERAFVLSTGARGLKQIIERILFDYNFNVVDYKNKKIVITKKYVEEKL